MLNTSSLGDRARDEERAEMIRREEALERWRTPAASADQAAAVAPMKLAPGVSSIAWPESKAPPDSDFSSGGSYL